MNKRRTHFKMTTSLRSALRLLSPHWREIRGDWKKKLAAIGVNGEAWSDDSPLLLEAQQRNLQLGNLEAYDAGLERKGRSLKSSGCSEAAAATAFTLYLESCLPYIHEVKLRAKDPVLALMHMVAIAQYASLSGFEKERVADWRKLQVRERLNLSRDLHDDVGHHLLVLKLYLQLMAKDLKSGDVSLLEDKLSEALTLVSHAVDAVKRLILDLGPAMVAQFGFLPAFRIYARQFTLRTGIRVRLKEANLPAFLPSNYETALYRVLQGALSNIVQHSHAKYVAVTLARTKKSRLIMTIEDDGAGFDVASTVPKMAFGLTAMRERVEMMGGRFHIESWPRTAGKHRHGTRIAVELPLDGTETGQGR